MEHEPRQPPAVLAQKLAERRHRRPKASLLAVMDRDPVRPDNQGVALRVVGCSRAFYRPNGQARMSWRTRRDLQRHPGGLRRGLQSFRHREQDRVARQTRIQMQHRVSWKRVETRLALYPTRAGEKVQVFQVLKPQALSWNQELLLWYHSGLTRVVEQPACFHNRPHVSERLELIDLARALNHHRARVQVHRDHVAGLQHVAEPVH
jgi:hypothetical protein